MTNNLEEVVEYILPDIALCGQQGRRSSFILCDVQGVVYKNISTSPFPVNNPATFLIPPFSSFFLSVPFILPLALSALFLLSNKSVMVLGWIIHLFGFIFLLRTLSSPFSPPDAS